MLKGNLLHAPIFDALGRAGHGSKILIADGNYPASTTLGPNATLVCLNMAPGVVNAMHEAAGDCRRQGPVGIAPSTGRCTVPSLL